MLSAQQSIVVPFAWGMEEKMLAELDNPNWALLMAFMAYMNGSGECRPMDIFSVEPIDMH